MFRIAKNAAGALALAGLVLSQPALAVRSSESLPASGARLSSDADSSGKSESLTGIATLGWVLALVVVAGVVLIIANDDNNNPVSP